MEQSTARIRVPVTKAIVEMIDEMSAADRDAIRRRASDSLAIVEDAPRSNWIPLAVQLDLLRAVEQHVGSERYHDFCQRHLMRTVETPLVRAVFDGAIRLFGMGPVAVFKVFGRSWSMMSCHAGDVQLLQIDPTDLRIELADIPLSEPNVDLFVEGFAATFTGIFRLFDLRGQVELVSLDPQRRTAQYAGHWTPKSA